MKYLPLIAGLLCILGLTAMTLNDVGSAQPAWVLSYKHTLTCFVFSGGFFLFGFVAAKALND